MGEKDLRLFTRQVERQIPRIDRRAELRVRLAVPVLRHGSPFIRPPTGLPAAGGHLQGGSIFVDAVGEWLVPDAPAFSCLQEFYSGTGLKPRREGTRQGVCRNRL